MKADPEDLKRHGVILHADYDPKRKIERIRGDLILPLKAPEGMMISWFSVGAAFRTHQGSNATKTANCIAYAAGAPDDFTEIYRAAVPTWVSHWRYNWDQDVILEEPTKQVYIKFVGDPGLNPG